MPFDEAIAGRIRDALACKRGVEEKMFGVVGFLLDGNMLVGVSKDSLIVHVGPGAYNDALLEPHVHTKVPADEPGGQNPQSGAAVAGKVLGILGNPKNDVEACIGPLEQ